MSLIPKPTSIRQRFTYILAGVVGGIFVVLSIIFILYNSKSLEKDLLLRLDNLTRLTVNGVSTALWQYNYEYIDDYLDSLFQYEDVVFASVYAENRLIRKKSRQGLEDKNDDYFTSSPSFLAKRSDVYYQGAAIGKIQLVISRDRVNQMLVRNGIIAAGVFFCIVSGIFVTMMILSRKYLFRPLARLESSARAISQGRLDAEIDTDSGDEIGNLARAFDQMMKELKSTMASRSELEAEVAERKRIEQTLRESEERFRILHNASFGGILIHEKGIILDCNQGLTDITGYSSDELIGMNGLDLIAPDWRSTVKLNMETGYEQPYEVDGIRKDGSIYPLYLLGKNIPYKGRSARVIEFRDITERKQAEGERRRLEGQLHQIQKMESVGQLAGGVAHDFNNMLSVILGHTEIAMRRSSPFASVTPHLKEIKETALRSADLVKQLLAFARKQTIAPKVLDINDLSSAILNMLRRIIGEDINLAWLPGADLWDIQVDPSQLDQLLVNLCVNARDAISDGGNIIIETKNCSFDQEYCAIRQEIEPGDYVMLSVSDDGCGMNKDIQEQVFEPFFTTKGLGEGTGLGLATVYGIVKQNNGFINLYSEPGKGTTFRVYLPRYTGEKTGGTLEVPKEAPRGKGETVLLVEDEAVMREVAETLLNELNYQVLSAKNPEDAIELVKTHSGEIQLLLTDVIMPGMNGRELAASIRNINPEIKCLFTSGYTANVIAHHGVLDEGICFLQKPFSLNELAEKVHHALAVGCTGIPQDKQKGVS